MIATVEQGR
jgi:hypothetical protein